MKYGIIADIHSNLEALQAVLAYLNKNKVDRLVVTGDVIGYGANPIECLELLGQQNACIVRGNHEQGLLSGELSSFRPEAATALKWTSQQLSPEWLAMINAWPILYQEADFLACHGAPDEPLTGYVFSKSRARQAFTVAFTLCFHGHTHFPGAYRQKETNSFLEIIPADFSGRMRVVLEPGWKYLINSGSAGQPRDGLPAACVGIYEPTRRLFSLERINYQAAIAREKIIRSGLPVSLGDRLLRGV
ncbi:MAG: metallophosphatase family protein [Candidatus Omnitrophica bacterium]|nr:metallophosphatase family protein [Candidatus Omnitrophota bacterium]